MNAIDATITNAAYRGVPLWVLFDLLLVGLILLLTQKIIFSRVEKRLDVFPRFALSIYTDQRLGA
jgi:hypothetical protein